LPIFLGLFSKVCWSFASACQPIPVSITLILLRSFPGLNLCGTFPACPHIFLLVCHLPVHDPPPQSLSLFFVPNSLSSLFLPPPKTSWTPSGGFLVVPKSSCGPLLQPSVPVVPSDLLVRPPRAPPWVPPDPRPSRSVPVFLCQFARAATIMVF